MLCFSYRKFTVAYGIPCKFKKVKVMIMKAELDFIKDLIANYVELDGKEVTTESRFIEDLGFNSYDFMSLIGEIEDEYDVEVNEKQVVKIKTVGEAIEYINSLVEE